MTVKDPNQKHYFSQLDPKLFDQTMKEITQSNHEIEIWQKGKDEEKTEKFQIIKYVPAAKKFLIQPSGSIWNKLKPSDLTNQEVLIKMSVQSVKYLTNSVLKLDLKNVEYFIEIKNTIFIAQQRRGFRLSASKYVKLRLTINNQFFDCLDVSIGGASFWAKEEARQEFPANFIFKDVTLEINRKKFNIPRIQILKILHTGEDTAMAIRPGMIKIAIKFPELPIATEEALCLALNDEARSEEIRRTLI